MIGFEAFTPLQGRIGRHATRLRNALRDPVQLDGTRQVDVMGQPTPVLTSGGAPLNLDCSIPDHFTAQTGATATIFARNGAEFVRISTSIKKQNGERALGTKLSHAHPGYSRLLAGQSYLGYATLFGKQYLTEYDTLKDAPGNVIGALYVGIDVSDRKPLSIGAIAAAAVFLLVTILVAALTWHLASAAKSDGFSAGAFSSTRDWHIVLGLLGALGIAALVYQLLHRMVTQSVVAARTAAQQLAAGDLTTQLHVSRNDEVGQLMQAINGISQGLAEIVSNVREAAQRINAASSEIASGNTDLSMRTASQAASLQQTAASMEELTATVKQNTGSAQQANAMAQSAYEVAGEGSKSVQQVIATMATIKHRSDEIHRIVEEVEAIAFQTNILSLNAAVEAARAGAQGSGFTVVAGEVRSLAQRSDTAAKRIKALILDSVVEVDAGATVVGRTRTTMEAIVGSVRKVTDIMREISVASAQQDQGIDEVNTAIAQMDSMTQQNAAMVEQAAAAAQSLNNLAQQLSQAVAIFRLSG